MAQAPGFDTGLHSQLSVFFTTMLQEAYWSEQHLVKVLETMSDLATNDELRQAFVLHREQTQNHVSKLSEVFRLLNQQPQAVPCVGMQGLFDEGWKVINETEKDSSNRDVALIIAAQKVEHYEIACYGSLVTLATTMGAPAAAKLLNKILQDEKQTDAALTSIAEGKVNKKAGREKVHSGDKNQLDDKATSKPAGKPAKKAVKEKVKAETRD